MQVPLCYVLQAIGFHYVIVGVCLDPQHVAGVRNEWADDLSRNCLEGFEQGCGGLDQFFDAGKVGLLGCHRRPI